MVGFPIVKLSFHLYVNLVFKKKLYYLNNNEKHLILQKALQAISKPSIGVKIEADRGGQPQ